MYTGQRFDKALGTYDFHSRQYDPVLGRFLQRDPEGSTNLYAYAANAPLALVDPLGSDARPEMDRAAAIEAYFKPYRRRLAGVHNQKHYNMTANFVNDQEEWAENSNKVNKVFAVYKSILNAIQDAALAERPLDLNALWEQTPKLGEATSWMMIHGPGRPALWDVGPFYDDRVLGWDVAAVFRLVTNSEEPNPSLPKRIFREVAEAVAVFGPDLAVGLTSGILRRGGIPAGAFTKQEMAEIAALGPRVAENLTMTTEIARQSGLSQEWLFQVQKATAARQGPAMLATSAEAIKESFYKVETWVNGQLDRSYLRGPALREAANRAFNSNWDPAAVRYHKKLVCQEARELMELGAMPEEIKPHYDIFSTALGME